MDRGLPAHQRRIQWPMERGAAPRPGEFSRPRFNARGGEGGDERVKT